MGMAMLRSISREPLSLSSCGGCQTIQGCLLYTGHKKVKSLPKEYRSRTGFVVSRGVERQSMGGKNWGKRWGLGVRPIYCKRAHTATAQYR